MRVPINWLNDYVNVELSPQQLAHELTMHALEVEQVIDRGAQIKKVVVGRIEQIDRHPDADKLVICQVDVGTHSAAPIQIVTGATNVFVGAVVPVSLVGAKLPGGVEIKQGKLRGVDSAGMLCSERELDLADDAAGILILPQDAPIGEDIVSYLGLDAAILDVAVLPNRGDCLSMVGMAREVAAITANPLMYPDLDIPPALIAKESLEANVIVEATDLCPRYMARVVKGITLKPSPDWMATRLESSGIRPINNIVDITNYILLEMGQPLHAFDYDKLMDKTIVVRKAKEHEVIQTLDGKGRELTSDMLVICDPQKPIAVAGVMGGADTEISDTTVNVLIEAAYFNPTSVRRTGVKLALRSESSQRFEKGIDFQGIGNALARAARLMAELGGGHVVDGVVDVKDPQSTLNKIQTVTFDLPKINAVLGMQFERDVVQAILRRLGYQFEGDQVLIPSWRHGDVSRIEDLIEDIIRIHGLDKLPATLPGNYVPVLDRDPLDRIADQARLHLIGAGLHEVISFSLTSPDEFSRLRLPREDSFALVNPLSMDESVMRTQMVSSLLNVLSYNKKRQNSEVKIFEIGRIFAKDKEGRPAERLMAAGVIDSAMFEGVISNLDRKHNAMEFLDVKGIVENLLQAVNVNKYQIEQYQDPTFHTGRAALLKVGNNVIGRLAQLHPEVVSAYDMSGKIYYFDVDLTRSVAYAGTKIKYKPLPKFPSTRRDTTIWVQQSVTAKQVADVIAKAGGKLLSGIELLDRYQGQNSHGEDYYNLTYSLFFQSEEKTLVDAEVNDLFDKIIDALKTKVGAKFG